MGIPHANELTAFARTTMPTILDAGAKSLVILAIAALVVCSLRRASAAMRHLVWFVALVSLALLPLLTAILPAWHVLPTWTTPLRGARTELKEQPSRKAEVASNPSPIPTHESPVSGPVLTGNPVGLEVSTPIPESIYADPMFLLFLLWLAGAASCLVPMLMGTISLWHLKRVSEPPGGSHWSEALERSLSLLKCRRPVVLLKSERRRMPMTWGSVRPILLLPDEAENWSEERRRMVLLHEVAHVKRWDFLANVVSQMIAAVYWFNPLVWVALRRMRAEREQACDDLVLGLGTKASEYATELLQIASAGLAPQFRTFGGIAIAHTSKLEQRLVAILDVHRNRKPVSARITVAALVFVMLALLPIALLRGAASQPSKTQDETRYFVRLVLADGKLSFEGDEVTWKTLDDRLQRIGDRAHTVFEFAISSEDLTLAQFKQAQAQAIELSKRFGFEYFSYIGVQPPGSKGSPPTPRRELASDQKKSAVTQTVDDDLKRISEIQQLLILLKSAEDEFNRASQLIKDHIIPETAFKRAQEYVELLKAEIQRKDGSVKRLEVRKAVSQAEDDFRRASVLFKDHIISEDAYNQAKERLDLVKAEINFDPAEAETARRLRTAEVQYRQAEDDFRRASELFKERIVSQSTFEAAKQKVDTLEYELARVKASQTNLPPVQRIGAQLQVAQRGLESLRSAHKDGLVTDEDYERAKKTVELLTEELKRSQEVLSR